MQLSFTVATLVFFGTTALAATADVMGWTERDCRGESIGCIGLNENQCCNFGKALNAIAWNLPADTHGRGFAGEACGGQQSAPVMGEQSNACYNYAEPLRSARSIAGSPLSKRWAGRIKRDGEDCATPNQYAYYGDDGKLVTKKITPENAVEVFGWIEKGQTDKLHTLEAF